jgi:hypothetical protein
MNENQKDQPTTENPGSEQKQDTTNHPYTETKIGFTPEIQDTKVEGEEESTEVNKEHQEKEHQHDYKTPSAEQNPANENQEDNENKTPEAGKNLDSSAYTERQD